MALTRISCPACGAGVNSAAGFTAGQAVSCPKCETEFTVDPAALRSATSEAAEDFVPGKPAPGAEEAEWSYRNSTLRYVVLGVLLVILVSLGYLLYDKKMKERQQASGDPEGRGIPPATDVPAKMMPLPGDPIAAGGPPGGAPKAKSKIEPKAKNETEPKAKTPSIDEAKAMLAGRWESMHDDQLLVVEYKADGTFSYSAGKDGKTGKSLTGKWNLTDVEGANTGPLGRVAILNMEWTIDGSPAIKEVILLRNDKTMTHLHLDQESLKKKVRSMFTKKK